MSLGKRARTEQGRLVMQEGGMRGLMAAFALMALATMAHAAPPPDIAQMIGQEDAYNEVCRGGSGDSPVTQSACQRRDDVFNALRAKGWCYGTDDQPMYQREWQPCQVAAAQAGRSALQVAIDNAVPLGAASKFINESMACPEPFLLDAFETEVGKANLVNDQNGRLEANVNARDRGCGPVPVGTVGKLIDVRDGVLGLVYYRMRFNSGFAYWVLAKNVRPAG